MWFLGRFRAFGTTDPYGSYRNEDTEDEIRKVKKCMKQNTFFYFAYFVFCVFVSLTTVRISRSVYFFTSNVLLIQVYLRSGYSQSLVAAVLPVYKLT